MRESLDRSICALLESQNIPGVSIGVIRGGKLVETLCYGVRDKTTQLPVTSSTIFQGASISKCFAAVAALRLVDQGRLSLDEDVNAQLRSWQVPANEFTAEAPVTVRRLLSHTAGITVHGFGGYAVEAPIPTLLQILDGEPPANNFPIRVDTVPGTQSRYSGGGYVVLQQLLIDVTGQPFPDLMRTLVLEPLSLNDTAFAQPLPDDCKQHAATGHLTDGKSIVGGAHVYPEMAAAGIWTTASDLAAFAIAIRQSFLGEPSAILSESIAREMLTPQIGQFGLGPQIFANPRFRTFTHSGRNAGFDVMFLTDITTGNGEVILLNANSDTKALPSIRSVITQEFRNTF